MGKLKRMEFVLAEWREILLALNYKANMIEQGHYGKKEMAEEGRYMYEGMPEPPYFQLAEYLRRIANKIEEKFGE